MMFRLRLPRPKPAWMIPFGSVLLGVVLYLLDPLPLQILRHAVFDQYQRWQPRVYEDAPVSIIDIDDESLARLGQWPWPRTLIADLVDRLAEAGSAATVFDVIFAEPDRTSPPALAKIWQMDSDLRQRLAGMIDHDTILAQHLRGSNVVLGHALTRDGKAPDHFSTPFRIVKLGPDPLPHLHPFKGSVAALPPLQEAAAGNGAISFVPDADGIVRRVPLLLGLADQPVPSLAAEALRVGQGASNILVNTDAVTDTGITSVRIGAVEIPTTGQAEVWVHYTRPRPERYIPAWQLLSDPVPTERLTGRIVLVGSSAQGLMDLRFSPLGGMIPGVETHAQAIEQILLGHHLSRPNWAPGLEVTGIVAGGLLVGFIGLSAGALLSASAAAGVLLITGYGAWLAYAEHGLLLDPLTPALALLIVFIVSSLYHHIHSERRQRWVKQAFARYVSPNLVNHLVDNPGQLELGGQRRECSFIFTDLAGFTNLMEKLDPTAAVGLLNEYLDNMIAIAFTHEGTLDRIVGDAVAIMFSAPVEQPDHRQRALDCALAMHHYARRHAAAATARGIPFGATRIGVHTGEVTVGNFGGRTIFDYRALGDPVNTAARLESVNKQLGTLVCVSENTLAGCAGVVARPVGKLVLKGKSLPLMVYQPILQDDARPAEPDAAYEAAYARLASGNPEARAAFEDLARERPEDPLVRLHLQRLLQGQTGEVIVFTEK